MRGSVTGADAGDERGLLAVETESMGRSGKLSRFRSVSESDKSSFRRFFPDMGKRQHKAGETKVSERNEKRKENKLK